eukprot:4406067-Prorocentrum_lima.AAC.1
MGRGGNGPALLALRQQPRLQQQLLGPSRQCAISPPVSNAMAQGTLFLLGAGKRAQSMCAPPSRQRA